MSAVTDAREQAARLRDGMTFNRERVARLLDVLADGVEAAERERARIEAIRAKLQAEADAADAELRRLRAMHDESLRAARQSAASGMGGSFGEAFDQILKGCR